MSTKRSFIQVSKAWYANTALATDCERFDITVEGVDWSSQFTVSWPRNSLSRSAELVVLDDGWKALANCNDLIVKVGTGAATLSPQELREHLLTCGFQDETDHDQVRCSTVTAN